jgi:hypothetical protein
MKRRIPNDEVVLDSDSVVCVCCVDVLSAMRIVPEGLVSG